MPVNTALQLGRTGMAPQVDTAFSSLTQASALPESYFVRPAALAFASWLQMSIGASAVFHRSTVPPPLQALSYSASASS